MNKKSSGIGGQAVLEGIMMKNKSKYAVAVRKPDQEIELLVKEYKGITNGRKILGLPFVRGIFNFIDSLVLGIKTLTYSSEFFDEEIEVTEDKAADKVVSSVFKEKAESVLIGLTVLFSIVLSVGLFMLLPYIVAKISLDLLSVNSNALLAVIEGVTRILIFLLYLVLISRMKDIQRTFMYHGAEHKCINCIENGYELNVDNVKNSSRQHKRCGTSFLLFVMLISVVAYIIVSAVISKESSTLMNVGVRLLLVPLIAGVSYEIIRIAGGSDNKFVELLSKPGLLLQKLTTKEPDDGMIEVAITAVEAVFDWKEYQENIGNEEIETDKIDEIVMEDIVE